MTIAYNPLKKQDGSNNSALSTAPSYAITFDLPGKTIYARGVEFKGTDTTYNVFKKHTSDSNGGYDGLVPVPDYNGNSKTRFLREDGTWVVPTDTTYSIVNSTTDGLAPKIGTSASATITTQADEWVLTSTKGATPTWRKLPSNAFSNTNNYRPISINGTPILENNNTVLNLVAGNNITLNPKKDSNNKYTGEVTITASNHAWSNITGKPTTLAGYGITDAVKWIGEVNADSVYGASVGYNTDSAAPYKSGFINVGKGYGFQLQGRYGKHLIYRGFVPHTDSTSENPKNTFEAWKYILDENGGELKGALTLQNSQYSGIKNSEGNIILGAGNSSAFVGAVDDVTTIVGMSLRPTVLRTSENNLWHYRGDKSSKYLILDTANASSHVVDLTSNQTISGKKTFSNLKVNNTNLVTNLNAEMVGGKPLDKLFAERGSIPLNNDDAYDYNKALIAGGYNTVYSKGTSRNIVNAPFDNYGALLYVTGSGDTWMQLASEYSRTSLYVRSGNIRNNEIYIVNDWKEIAFTDSNVASATKLQTARKIWGKSFDGTADVTGNLTIGASSIVGYKGTAIFSDYGNGNVVINANVNDNNTLGGIYLGYENTSFVRFGSQSEEWGKLNKDKFTITGTVIAPAFQGNLDGSYINKLTGYTKATTISAIAANDTLNAALGKLEFKTDFIYNDLFGTDNDGIINKWHEIVDFVDSVAESTDITEEFVTRKTAQTITGTKWVDDLRIACFYKEGGCAKGIRIYDADKTNKLGGIGVLYDNNSLTGIYLGWGSSPWNKYNSLFISDSKLTYKNNEILDASNYTNYKHSYTNLTGSTTTANQAIVSNGTKDGWKLQTLGPGAFQDDYPMLNLGTLSDYVEYVLLLHPINGSTDWKQYYSYGTIYTHRSNGLSPCSSIIYNSISKYNSTDVYVSMVQQGRKYAQWCTCTYNRQKYCGLKLYTQANHSSDLTIKGRWNSDPVLVKYKTNSNGNITSKEIIHNEEIANSIVVEGDDIIIKSTHGKFNGTFEGNITGGTVGSVLYQSTADITSFLNPPSTESILTSKGGVPYWTSLVSVRGYIGTTPVQSTSTDQSLTGITSLNMSDNINILSGNSDKYITFGYSNNAFTSADAYSWRLGYIGSRENNSNYFKIQSSHGNTWTDVLKLGLQTYEATFSGNVIASGNVTASGDIIIKNSGINAATPYLKFQRGSTNDSYVDWRFGNNNSGKLILQYNINGSNTTTETWNDVFVTTRTVSTFNSALEVAGSQLTLGNSNGSTLIFKRPSANYIWADEPGGHFVIGVKDVGTTSIDNASLQITKEFIQPGRRNNAVYLGNSSYRWANIFSVLGNFGGNVTAAGFVKSNSSDSHVLLGAGGHKALSDFLLETEFASKELGSNLTTITKTLVVSKDWVDTGIVFDTATFPNGTGSYIVQLSRDDLYYWTGCLSIVISNNVTAADSDEILLHGGGFDTGIQYYLRTVHDTTNKVVKLQIARNNTYSTSKIYTFKFKKLI